MSSSKKRKNDTSKQTKDDSQQPRQTVYVVQSDHQENPCTGHSSTTHSIFSNLATANEAARLTFNTLAVDLESITAAELASAAAARLETGRRIQPIRHGDDEYDHPKEIEFQASGAVSIELDQCEVANAECGELRVWVATFVVDADEPAGVDEERAAEETEGKGQSVRPIVRGDANNAEVEDEMALRASRVVPIELNNDVGEGEELGVWRHWEQGCQIRW